jgi:hypothetical protein
MNEARITIVKSSDFFFILSIIIVYNKDNWFATKIVPDNFKEEKPVPENEKETDQSLKYFSAVLCSQSNF